MIISDYEYFLLFNNTSGTFSIFFSFSQRGLVGLYKPVKKKKLLKGTFEQYSRIAWLTHNNYKNVHIYINIYTCIHIYDITEPTTMYVFIRRNGNLLINQCSFLPCVLGPFSSEPIHNARIKGRPEKSFLI